jgi:hypothetical protein
VRPSRPISIKCQGSDGWNLFIIFYFYLRINYIEGTFPLHTVLKSRLHNIVPVHAMEPYEGNRQIIWTISLGSWNRILKVGISFTLLSLSYFPFLKGLRWTGLYILQHPQSKVTKQIFYIFMQYLHNTSDNGGLYGVTRYPYMKNYFLVC